MKIGLILAQNNEMWVLPRCLESWIKYKEENELLITALDVCFKENGNSNSTDGSLELLQKYKEENKIDFLEKLPSGLQEHEARNVALKWLLERNCTETISIGADELFTTEEINQIFNYVKKDPFTAVFKIHYKNYVGDENHYVKGFTPHRIWRAQYQDKKIKEFFWDDDLKYIDNQNNEISDKQLPSKVIPNIFIKHLTWLDGERSRNKINYQMAHFGGCSYKMNGEKVVLNLEFYKKTGQVPPEILSDV